MKTLAAAVSQKSSTGRTLPPVFDIFARNKIQFFTGEVSMFAGEPGAGKSGMALWHATRWVARHGLRGIYFSADSSPLVQASRSLAMVSEGVSVEDAQHRIEQHDDHSIGTLHDKLDGLAWCFDSEITYKSIEMEVEAFAEAWGVYPDFIIIDNLFNVEQGGESEHSGLRKALEDLLVMGRFLDTHVMVLHHTSEAHRGEPCPPRAAVQGKVNQTPYVIVTLAATDGHTQQVCAVKNRVAPPKFVDKLGRQAITLRVDSERFHYGG